MVFTKRNMDKLDTLSARVLDAADRIKERENQLRRTTLDLNTRVAKRTEVGGGIYEEFFFFVCAVTNLSIVYNRFAI